jgi:uncharacterized protein DUF4388
MTKPKVTATSRLADVIEVVELGRRTGLLMVERGSGEMVEEGEIYFLNGRATYAAVERVRGQDALAVLGGWGACRFSFDTESGRPATNLSPSAPSAPASQDSWSSMPSRPMQRETSGPASWNGAPSQTSSPNYPTFPSAPNSASQVPPSSQPSGPFSTSWPDPRSGAFGGTNPNNGQNASFPTSGSLPLPQGWPLPDGPITPPTGPGLPMQRQASRAEGNLLRRPRRTQTASDLTAAVQRFGLSRAHRTLLMLADGDHNVLDIARLSSKQIKEAQTLLAELEGQGLIYYSA